MSSPLPDRSHTPVLLSASIPDEIAGTPNAQRIYGYVTVLVRSLLGAGIPLIFGGHPTITPLVHRAAKALGDRKPSISLYQLERFRGQEPPETADNAVFDDTHWLGDPNLDIEADLVQLRDPMTAQAQAAVFIGGKTTGFSGGKPGIRDEYERFRTHHPDGPAYLIGRLGGETIRLIAEATAGIDLEHNGLTPEARREVHTSDDESLVAALIVQDLRQRLGKDRVEA
ncbi:hypothetical protein [Candidatus Thiosymbion oneisti]|uniref:SLOG domain-containing protein n=1 Tax=Candidatus Thiosymbion oneisti TaxID=589554 RepID=UPI0010619047|nr:hypothetical protein [Candidatus Thiosymbion oneisti]